MAESFASGAFYTQHCVQYRQKIMAQRRKRAHSEMIPPRAAEGSPLQQRSHRAHTYTPTLQQFSLSLLPEVPPYASQAQHEEEEEETEPMKETGLCSPGPRRWVYKNLYAVSIAFTLVYSAFIGLQSLQSSLNASLGLVSLALTYGFFFLIGFVTPGIIRFLGTKYAILFGFLCHTIYLASNFYPEYYTLIPSSILLGIGSGPVFAGTNAHVGITAVSLAPHVTESIDIIISKFTATFFFLFKSAQIFGNIVSSLVFFPYGESKNDTTPDVCDNTAASDVDSSLTYILLSIYLVYNISGIVILLVFANKLDMEFDFSLPKRKLGQRYCSEPFVALLKVLFSWKMMLLGPLSFYTGLELSFTFGTFTQVYISQCVGVSKVGFALIAFGIFGAGMSFFYGKLVKCIPRIFVVTAAALINAFFLLFLLFWSREPSYELIFLYVIFWGVADGVLTTAPASLVSILYPEDQEAAYSAFRIWMSLGLAFGFGLAQSDEVDYILITVLCTLVFSCTLYVLLEFFISRFGAKCCKRKEETMTIDEGLQEKMLEDKNITFNKQAAVESVGYTLYAEEQ